MLAINFDLAWSARSALSFDSRKAFCDWDLKRKPTIKITAEMKQKIAAARMA